VRHTKSPFRNNICGHRKKAQSDESFDDQVSPCEEKGKPTDAADDPQNALGTMTNVTVGDLG
jgi:hypothetical protein